MSDAMPGALPRHLQVSGFDLALEPGRDGRLHAVVQDLRLRITGDGLRTLARELVAEADRRAPVGLALRDLSLSAQGIDLALRLQKSILRGELATRLVLSAPGGDVLRAEFANLDVPAWVPFDLLLDEAVKRAGGVVWRDPDNRRALLLDPAALLTRFGLPGRFVAGTWDVTTGDNGVALTFIERLAG